MPMWTRMPVGATDSDSLLSSHRRAAADRIDAGRAAVAFLAAAALVLLGICWLLSGPDSSQQIPKVDLEGG